ncbi:BCCT family transporter [Mycolicibacterium wolinskyi]|nr:BCCT family transporter [Mycolicibacterium wolinskyi]MCV7293639.1 BCCT family transporter [Mycolicibacterium goodii]
MKARLHETFPGPGIPIPEGQDDDELDVPLCARRAVTDKAVFGVAAVLVLVILGWGLIWPASFQSTMATLLDWVVGNLGWLFIITATCFVLFAVWLAMSRYGRIPLGADDEKPEFHTVSWIAMMFSAGMGIGLIFWGVTEPLTHFVNPPPGLADSKAGTALATSLFHWGFHPWSMYAVVGLSIAYGSYRMGRRQLISSSFASLLGIRRVEGPIGKLIDILAIFATMFGTAASLGLGALQIGSGIEVVGWVEQAGTLLLVTVVGLLTFAFVASAVSGVSRGIQWLSNINMVLALILAVFVFVLGPTVFILNLLPTALGDYAANLAAMSARSAADGPETEAWLSTWTIFYWAWWISWTPFVGMFLARISRGRTIRQFVVGVIFVPTTVSLIWFVIFGGAGIGQQRDAIDVYGTGEPESTLFGMLDHLPLAGLSSLLVMALVAIFFVSGADAASMVMGTLSQSGSLFPSRWAVAFWGLSTGAVAALMLWAGGNDALNGLQTMTIIVAAPFVFVMVGMCVSLYLDVSRDPLITGARETVPSGQK